MKINILLPFKEEFDCNNSGAVSILVKEQFKYSKFKKNINIYGVKTSSKHKFWKIFNKFYSTSVLLSRKIFHIKIVRILKV